MALRPKGLPLRIWSLVALAGCVSTDASERNDTEATIDTPPSAGGDELGIPDHLSAWKPSRDADSVEPAESEVPVRSSDDDSESEVRAVTVSGGSGAFRFAVTLASGDTGCEHYADWWEVLDGSGKLLYRRILAHSHPDEQPFTRSGGPVDAEGDDRLIIRFHTNDAGYSRNAMVGSPTGGFRPLQLPEKFASHVANKPPQPDGCAF